MPAQPLANPPARAPDPVKPHLLLFLSDQHNGQVTGYAGDPVVETPHLDRLARDGARFEQAYTPCPLCVPARVAFLTGHLPSRNAAFTNSAAVPEDHATWLHGLVAAGYETVLCGRMHFLGEDQRHGFTSRIFPDFTPQFWQSGRKFNSDLGDYAGTLDASESTLRAIGGGGVSPVLEYDRAVVETAVRFLETRSAPRPLCLVVGTYGPHNPFVCDAERFAKYAPRTGLPRVFGPPAASDNPLTRARRVPLTEAQVRTLRAAYYGMVETIDAQVGEVRSAWEHFLGRAGHPGVFAYTSDHGEHMGERNILAKQTFFEPSVRVPLVMAGNGIPRSAVRRDLASFLDLGPTLCGLAGASPPPRQDGLDLFAPSPAPHDRAVVSELMEEYQKTPVLCRMVRRGPWKLITHSDPRLDDLLFDLDADPDELHNRAADAPIPLQALRQEAWKAIDPAAVIDRHQQKLEHARLLIAAGDALGPPEDEVWTTGRGTYRLPTLRHQS